MQLQQDAITIQWTEVNQPFIRVSIEVVNLEKHGQWQLQDDGIRLHKGKESRPITTVSSLGLQTQPFWGATQFITCANADTGATPPCMKTSLAQAHHHGEGTTLYFQS